ncbi:MAG: T9SS type A sorting domain-containing protein [Cyclobacteriaceae bacterium]
MGNLIISGKGGLNLENGGVLVVVGNMTVEGNSVNNNNGTIIVAQNLSVSGNTNFNNNAGAGQGIYPGSVSGNKTISGGSILPLDNSSSGRDAATEHSLIYNTVIRPQPVELLTFQGKSTARGIQLDWITAWEENFDYFIVERAGTDRQFKAIGKVQGNGNTQAEVAYNFTDEQPIQGQALYRLKAVDYDNSYEYHNIISVYFDGMYKQALKVYPNPSADRLIHVDLNSEIHTITLLNTNGQLIYQTMVNNYSASIDLPTSIRSGAYLLVVTDEQGNSVKEKIMVL